MDEHVTKHGAGQSRVVRCRYCIHKLPNNTARWKSHLAKCQRAPVGADIFPRKRQAASLSNVPTSKHQTLPLQTTITSSNAWVDTISEADKIALDKLYANIFYSSGVTFRLADSPALAKFVNLARPAYKTPSAKSSWIITYQSSQ